MERIEPQNRRTGITCNFTVGIFALGVVSATAQGPVSDPNLQAKAVQACRIARADTIKDLCSPDGGGPKGPECAKAVQFCTNLQAFGGVLLPKYIITNLIYAPPGCTSSATLKCNSQSQVQYLSQSSSGTKVAISSSIKTGIGLSVDLGISLPGFGSLSDNTQTSLSVTTTDGSSNSVTKGSSSSLTLASNGDGIDHEQDQIVLLLNPSIAIAQSFGLLDWQLGFQGASATTFPLTISELRDPSKMAPGTKTVFDGAGFTQTDFDTIRSADPFANLPSGHTITDDDFDKTRFTQVLSFPYKATEVSASCNNGLCSCLIPQNSISNTFASDQTTEKLGQFSLSYSVGAKASSSGVPGGPPIPTVSLGVTTTDSLTVTSSSTTTNSKSATNTASVILACPSSTYAGGALVDVYWDALFGSFAFNIHNRLVGEQLLFRAKVTPLALKAKKRGPEMPVAEFEYGGRHQRSIPDPDGIVRFYGVPKKGLTEGTIRYSNERQPRKVRILQQDK
jgi:hypothetical protein